jgi:serine/threonine-protein kinase HipA
MDIYVYIDALNLTDEPLFMGVLSSENVRGKEIFSFRANKGWLKNNSFVFLDADLQLYSGNQYVPEGKNNFGIFLDSCPDRWGRVLMQRRERIKAKEENRQIRKLKESDYLLGGYDGNRMGALRFKTSPDGPFLDNDAKLATPPITSLRALEQASLNYERTDAEESPEYQKWIHMLYSPGSSLGGARPKANVVDTDDNLWIAKFPSRHDTIDVGAWEYMVTEMARDFGINVPETKLKKFSSCYHTFLTKRFDRQKKKRLYFASAMTLLGYTDGDNAAEGVSYLELAEFLQRFGTPQQQDDLQELWKRIVFNIAISNCDDHLRNHGFMLTPKGWILSPVYDLTPNPDGWGLKLNIDETDNSLNYDVALHAASWYSVDSGIAAKLISQCKVIVSGWRERATNIGISRSEQEQMISAFKL